MEEFSKEILHLEGVEERLSDLDKYYEYGDKRVPRVTSILSQCENQEGLIRWAAGMGYKKYTFIKESSLEIGNIVHESIDHYLIDKYNYDKDFNINYDMVPDDYKNAVYNSFENFKLWEANLQSLGYRIEEVFGLEIPVVTPWYGGTIDAIFKINGAYYIIDFKTSKKISNSYLLQTSAYMYAVNNGYGPNIHIDGIGIIRVDKTNYGIIDDLFLTSSDPMQSNIILNHISCFWSYLVAYYNTMSVNYQGDKYVKTYDLRKVL